MKFLSVAAACCLLSATLVTANELALDNDIITLNSAPDQYAQTGNFKTISERIRNEDLTVFRPVTLEKGIRYPVVTWANGSGTPTSSYKEMLTHLASHGFIVLASNSTKAMQGEVLLKAAQWVMEENQDSGSIYFERIDKTAIASIGHSQGGVAAVKAAKNKLFSTAVLVAPGPFSSPKDVKGTTFFIAGAKDRLVIPLLVKALYRAAPKNKIYGELADASHMSFTGDMGNARGYITAWFYSSLLKSKDASSLFYGANCGLCTDENWEVKKEGLE